tara:strand:- start:7354 stop:7566 length:213 start_codon:yes stop_codon:yes gene_type:complete
MGNKKGLVWYLTLFQDLEKTIPIKTIPCKTIKDISYLLDLPSSVISNYYHKQIKARGVLKYCNISQNLSI